MTPKSIARFAQIVQQNFSVQEKARFAGAFPWINTMPSKATTDPKSAIQTLLADEQFAEALSTCNRLHSALNRSAEHDWHELMTDLLRVEYLAMSSDFTRLQKLKRALEILPSKASQQFLSLYLAGDIDV